jgi:hypothetical protein
VNMDCRENRISTIAACGFPSSLRVRGVPAGKRVDAMVYQHSMFATTCELSGVKTPAHVEFPSLAPNLAITNTFSACYGRA